VPVAIRLLLHRFRREPGAASTGVALAGGGLIVAATIFTGSAIGGGALASARLQDALGLALTRVTTGVELRGGVVARSDGAQITTLTLGLATTAGGGTVLLDPDAGEGALLVQATTDDAHAGDVPYSVAWLAGDGDATLEPGELAAVTVDLASAGVDVRAGERVTLELHPGDGAPLTFARTVPAGAPLPAVMLLP